MLTFKNNLLTSDKFYIDTPDSIIELHADVTDCNYFGILTLTNGVTKTIQFVKFNTFFKARLSLYEEDLNFLQGATLKLLSVSSTFSKESNCIKPEFNINKIKITIKQNASKELSELKKEVLQLQNKLEALSLGKLVPAVNIANKDYIKPGMILVAIDDGNFMAAYPFADIVTNVNGQTAVDGVVELDASMIKYTVERSIAQQLKVMGEAISAQNNLIVTISGELASLSQRVADLTIKLATHLDNGII